MMENAIGSTFEWQGLRLLVEAQVRNQPSCARCVFTDDNFFKTGMGRHFNCCNHPMECNAHRRKDKSNVIFILYEEN